VKGAGGDDQLAIGGEDGEPKAPAPSRDDVRAPGRRERRRGREKLPRRKWSERTIHVGPLLTILLIGVALITQWAAGVDTEPGSQAPHGLRASAETREYLSQVRAICQAHDREIAADDKTTIAQIVRSETAVTSRMAALSAPVEAREIRRHLIAARRRMDRTTVWVYRVMERSEHPLRVYSEKLQPVVFRRTSEMYQTFGSYGVHCNTGAS
jgi:hypothetical protein